MTRDASLDDFLGGDDEDEPAADGDAAADQVVDDDGPADAAEPAAGEGAAESTEADAQVDAEDTATADEGGAPLSPDSVPPAASTYAWSPDGADCAACGATVERRWRGDSGLVCTDCKEW